MSTTSELREKIIGSWTLDKCVCVPQRWILAWKKIWGLAMTMLDPLKSLAWQLRVISVRVSGGWILGNEIDGTQAEHVRITHTSFSLHPLSDGAEPKATVMLSDVFRTAYEAGMLNGQVKPGSEVVIIGSGPIGLVALVTLKKLFGPSQVAVIGREQSRLDVAKGVGVDHTLST
ncbi:hypothetical protein ETB97_006841 [Aspergillus alliaceus]|uniref:Alcohol dehydrogenase-like C-terminal domain-containing protein n=1 Tax=Petromyces alliaceus TaxID=209559 RepID=A0A8H6AE57_PETAA|nr:hypothetical protein ETB97_006841 [Aspergillus burnettii]